MSETESLNVSEDISTVLSRSQASFSRSQISSASNLHPKYSIPYLNKRTAIL